MVGIFSKITMSTLEAAMHEIFFSHDKNNVSFSSISYIIHNDENATMVNINFLIIIKHALIIL